MPEKLKCPSCGGHELGEIDHNGRKYRQCRTVRAKRFGSGKNIREVTAPCGFWTTKESAWLPNKSS